MDLFKTWGCIASIQQDENDKNECELICSNLKQSLPNVIQLETIINGLTLEDKNKILDKCELNFVCKICREMFCSIEHFVDHCESCCDPYSDIDEEEETQNSSVKDINGFSSLDRDFNNQNAEVVEVDPMLKSIKKEKDSDESFALNDCNHLSENSINTVNQEKSVSIKEEERDSEIENLTENRRSSRKRSLSLKAIYLISQDHVNKRLKTNLPKRKQNQKQNQKQRPIDTSPSIPQHSYHVILSEEEISLLDLNKLRCLRCNNKFHSQEYLKKHLAVNHLGYPRFKCKFCNFKSSNLPICKEHMQENHAIQNMKLDKMIIHLYCT